MSVKVLSVLVLLGSAIYILFSFPKVHPDCGLNVKQLIEKYGFPFENHTVTTEDGYILALHRIPYGRIKNNDHKREPVLIMPGTFATSADWVNMGENSLGFILADRGYDVWLANYRGSTWSRKHVKLNPEVNKEQFWDWSFHDIGIYDLPALLDYILHITKEEKLFYIGHSQGAVDFFALNSEKPEYNKKFRLMIGLAPVGYFSNAKSSFVHFIAAYQNEIQAIVDRYQLYEILPHSPLLATISQTFCNDNSPFQGICAFIFYLAVGHSNQLNKTLIPVIVSNTPAGSSFKHWRHAAQVYISDGKVPKYDYGEQENLKKYGQPYPPEYNLTQITAPVALYYGANDIFCAQEDIDKTASMMRNVVVNKRVPDFNHIDVVCGIDVVKVVFSDILKLMKQY
ncbi:hypothetical protein ILUMI_19251 [Ignelater luminosus]|uniref:Lipase n=1 Tax=Ignelater luminosus TaxID=2038154 RepID=A0A8K0G5S0_IGNLU|nr:hypothetical protein ILUMI_19251 [Ignelater luminosus]